MTVKKPGSPRKLKNHEHSNVDLCNLEQEFMEIYLKYVDQFKSDSRIVFNQVLNSFKKKVDSFAKNHEKELFFRVDKAISKMEKFCDKIDKIEETFFIIYGNIKRNQFLYVNHPADWWEQNHSILKEKLNDQNADVKSILQALYNNETNQPPKKHEKAS